MYAFPKTILALSAALMLGLSAAAAAPRDPARSDRSRNPIAAQSQFVGGNVHAARAQVVAPYETPLQWDATVYRSQPWGPISSSSIYGGGF